MAYYYIENEIGERRSPIAQIETALKWLDEIVQQYTGEILVVSRISEDDFFNDNYPGYWVLDDGTYSS